MTKSEQLFHEIAELNVDAVESNFFGALSIKAKNGKTAAFFRSDSMTFKLNEESQIQALELKGTTVGSHLYDGNKPMKGWVFVPSSHMDKWAELTDNAVKYVQKLK